MLQNDLVGLMMGWQVQCTKHKRLKWCGILLAEAVAQLGKDSALAENAPAYISAQLLAHDEADANTRTLSILSAEAPVEHRPIVMRAGAVWLKEQWSRVEADSGDSRSATTPPPILWPEWEMLHHISRHYFDGCIALAASQTELLRETYKKTRSKYNAIYQQTSRLVMKDNFGTYEDILEGQCHR